MVEAKWLTAGCVPDRSKWLTLNVFNRQTNQIAVKSEISVVSKQPTEITIQWYLNYCRAAYKPTRAVASRQACKDVEVQRTSAVGFVWLD